MLLCSVPQLAEFGTMPWGDHWREIELLVAIFARLENVSVVVSPHPRSNPGDYPDMTGRIGLTS